MKKIAAFVTFTLINHALYAQSVKKSMLRLPDTGEKMSYTTTFGEDNDYTINPPYFIDNGNGTLTDTVTGLMWQKADGGEMTIEKAINYCDTLNLAGYSDWHLPNAHEAYSILNHQYANPSLDVSMFTTSAAEYWWTSDRQSNDSTKIWCTNAGGGIGNHPKAETISAGGTKKFHPRAVRDVSVPTLIPNHFTNNGNGTITDNLTNLTWQQVVYNDSLTWEAALGYADTLTLAGYADWRLPNIKEIQSINDEKIYNPSINTSFFSNIGIKNFWSSTTLPNQTTKAWYLDTHYGITTYQIKTARLSVLLVRGNGNSPTSLPTLNLQKKMSVFPNPFSNYLHIVNATGQEQYELVNILGERIYSGREIEKQDFSTLAKGIYLLKISGQKLLFYKLIKE